MIKPNEYYPKQMNGPVISAFGAAQENELEATRAIADYLHGLSIATAQETELENIGRIIGYPRPLVPEGFNDENLMVLGSVPIEIDETNGLAAAGTEVGGELATTQLSETGYMGLNLYRKFLDKMAILKRYGITLYSVNKIASIVDNDYEIGWNEAGDITLHYNSSIGYKNIWILTQLFYRIATAPQVVVTSG